MCSQALSRFGHDLELHRSADLLLDDSRAISDVSAAGNITDLDLYEVAAAQLARDIAMNSNAVLPAAITRQKALDLH